MKSNLFFISAIIIGILFELTVGMFERPSDCGRSELTKSGAKQFIVGGSDARIGEFPFMVSLQDPKSVHFCGGTIINKRWVLTASHCISLPLQMGSISSPKDISLIVGTVDKTVKTHLYKGEKWIVSGCFSPLNDDIALIKTNRDIEMIGSESDKPIVNSICLPPKDSEPISCDVISTGWGAWTSTGRDSPILLQKTQSTIHSEFYCFIFESFRSIGLKYWKLGSKICAFYHNSTACFGDSGGPVLQVINGKVHQLGIASFISGVPFDAKCNPSNPVLYTKLSKYIDWIETNIDKSNDSNETNIKTDC